MTRTCTKCGETKPLETDFYRNPSGLGGYRASCKACHNGSTKANRTANPERERAYGLARRKKFAAKIFALKEGKPCTDCGGRFPPVCMDWDHLPGSEKVTDIGRMANYPWAAVLAEIAKCELVCANCHRVRSWTRRRAALPA